MFYTLSDKCYTNALDLTTERRRNFGHRALYALDLRELGTYSVDDICSCRLDSTLRMLHRALHDLVYREVVYRLGDIILAVKLTQRCAYRQIYTIAVTHLLLQIVAAVIGT